MAPTLEYVSVVNLQTGLIMIRGSGFTGTTSVFIGAAAALSFTVVSDTAILADSANPLVLGAVDIAVTTGSGSATAAVTISIGNATPGGGGGGGGGPAINESTIPTMGYAAEWDTNLNLSANNFLPGFTSTVTAGGTTTLTVASAQTQVFTGSTAQNIVLPATGVTAGFEIQIINKSTGSVTVKSFNNSVILTLAGSSSAPYQSVTFIADTATPTLPTDWDYTTSAASVTINNLDGTLSVNGINTLEPLSTVTIVTTNTAPAIGQTTYYNATSGNLTPGFPALSGLRVGARLAVRRDPADTSANTVTLTCAGSDTFYSSGATTAPLPMSGEQREYQVISVSGTKYWVPAGSLNPVSALDKRYLHAWPFPMARNTIAVIGDSISALGTGDWYQPWLGHTWINQLIVMSHQRIRYGAGNFSVAGTTISQQRATQLPQVLAMNPLPGACVLALSTNDLAGAGFNLATEVAALKTMITALEAVGVVPILWCPPPDNHTGGAIAVSAVHANMYLWNTWVRRFAAANGYALVDANTALALQDGTAISGSIDSSGVHPTGYGARLIAEQALADGVADIFPPNSLANTARTTDDLTNMFGSGTLNWGLFTTDANSDGVADGLSKGTSGTASLVAPQVNEQLAGKWQQLTVPATQTGNITAVFSTGWSIGDTIAFSYRLKTQNIETNLGWHMAALKTDTPGGFITPDGTSESYLWNGPVQWDCDVDDGEVYVEFVIPPQATDLQLWISLFGGVAGSGCTLWVGELTARNLTTQGLLV